MFEKPETRLLWDGKSTLLALRELVQARLNFELQLPPDYHFALFRHLYPHAATDAPGRIDISGGAELIGRIADIRGLNELAELASLVAASHAQVRVLSPGPGIQIHFPDTAVS